MAKRRMKLTPKEQAHVSKGMSKKMVDVGGNPLSRQRKLAALHEEVRKGRQRGWTTREAKGPSKVVRRRPKLAGRRGR
ncbi:MAG: hypothetical protein GTN80_08180 [Nitrososphaeria archaeon]|nr:hypothetical protein [Nitrososphaeria archaeon]NIQ33600.1 hypothetical protein [Nitrososphaeria archaeon]